MFIYSKLHVKYLVITYTNFSVSLPYRRDRTVSLETITLIALAQIVHDVVASLLKGKAA